jgi:hypothetical protein
MRDEFDDIIKRKLGQLPSEGTPDWSAMQDRIEGEAFDALLRNQFNSTTSRLGADKVVPAVVGWDALEHKLDLETEIEGDVFDRILAQKLSSVETSVQPEASWKVLSHRMDTMWPLRRVLVRYRALEIAAAIALLLTFAPHLRDNPISLGIGTSPTADVLQELPQRSQVLDEGATGDFLAPHEIEALVYETNGPTVQPQNSAAYKGNSSQSASSVATVDDNTGPIYSPFALLKSVVGWFGGSSPSEVNQTLAEGHASDYTFQGSIADANATHVSTSVHAQPSTVLGNQGFTAIDLLGLSAIPFAKNVGATIPAPSEGISKWEAGTFSGYQVWKIRTPTDAEFEQQATSRLRGSTNFGLSANRKLNDRTALGLGASYTHLTYDPNLPTVFDAGNLGSGFNFSRTESFEGITVNIAQIPVDLRVQLTKPGKRLNLLAFAGLAANLTLQSDYDVERIIGAPPVLSGPPSETEEFIENENTFSDVKEFSPGILEKDGRFSGNTFLSARVGLESTFQLNKRLSAFSSLTYNHFVPTSNGFGPNNDQLSSLGLNVGVRVSL